MEGSAGRSPIHGLVSGNLWVEYSVDTFMRIPVGNYACR